MKLFKRFNYFSFHLSLTFFLSSLAIILLFSTIVYHVVSNIFLTEAISNYHTSMIMSSDSLSNYLESAKSKANTFSLDPELLEFLVSKTYRADKISTKIDNIIKYDHLIKAITVVSKDGRIVSSDSKISMNLSDDMMKQKWYIDAINTKMPVLTGARMQDDTTWVISLSVEIQKNHENLGVLLFDLDYALVEKFISGLNLGNKGSLFIINHLNEMVYHTKMSYIESDMSHNELITTIGKGNHYQSDENLLHYHLKIKNSDWSMHGIFSLDGLANLKHNLLKIVVFISISLMFLSIIISYIFSRNLKKPLDSLIKEMDNIEALNNIVINHRAYNEIEILSLKYNEMVFRIKKLLSDLKIQEANLKKAEISALISQINPHFLYNTLDTIIWTAEFNEKDKVIDLTKSLASFFRLSLSKGSDYTSLKDEVKHVTEYLFIQKQRYEDHLQYEIINDLEDDDLVVPKIILQPLVENALYHGLKNNGGLNIWIKLFKAGNFIYLDVCDDGKGSSYLDQEFIGCQEFLNRIKDIKDNRQTKSGSVGMNNVDERIRLYFKGRSGLYVKNNHGFVARIMIEVK
ncbi:MAG: histidine kinase [Erysipelotrichaceae bacterium]|nr:histidine kinase [Erysipelotrichaceae bacterium]